MNAFYETLYMELRQTEQEIRDALQKKTQAGWLKELLEKELTDIEKTINKFEIGNYGQCEISGELIPYDLLKVIPTLKSINEFQSIGSFYRKSLNEHC